MKSLDHEYLPDYFCSICEFLSMGSNALNRSIYLLHIKSTVIYVKIREILLIKSFSDELYDKMVKLKLQIKEERLQLHEVEIIYQYSKKLLESSIEVSFIGK